MSHIIHLLDFIRRQHIGIFYLQNVVENRNSTCCYGNCGEYKYGRTDTLKISNIFELIFHIVPLYIGCFGRTGTIRKC